MTNSNGIGISVGLSLRLLQVSVSSYPPVPLSINGPHAAEVCLSFAGRGPRLVGGPGVPHRPWHRRLRPPDTFHQFINTGDEPVKLPSPRRKMHRLSL